MAIGTAKRDTLHGLGTPGHIVRGDADQPYRPLLVIVPDQLTQIIEKGELQPRYYNPGNLFTDVHILMTNADQPPIEPLRYLAGNANVHIHNHPDDLTLPHCRWKKWWHHPLRVWAAPGVEIARRIRPRLIRCHGADWNVYLASRIKRALGVPYAVSLHINPDVNPPRRHLGQGLSKSELAHNEFYEYIEASGLRDADVVMPVYKSILPYLSRLGVKRVDVCYNVLNGSKLRQKLSYIGGSPFRIICVGRLIAEKNPDQLIRAVASVPETELTIVGDGPERPALECLVADLGVGARVTFRLAIENDELCTMLPDFDLFAVHTEYWELNKSVLEALLTGLPVVINRRKGQPVPELDGADFVRMVENTTESYGTAIAELMVDEAGRAALGQRAYAHAQAHWSPAVTEAKVMGIYRRLMRSEA